jgi:hypothetical protein
VDIASEAARRRHAIGESMTESAADAMGVRRSVAVDRAIATLQLRLCAPAETVTCV